MSAHHDDHFGLSVATKADFDEVVRRAEAWQRGCPTRSPSTGRSSRSTPGCSGSTAPTSPTGCPSPWRSSGSSGSRASRSWAREPVAGRRHGPAHRRVVGHRRRAAPIARRARRHASPSSPGGPTASRRRWPRCPAHGHVALPADLADLDAADDASPSACRRRLRRARRRRAQRRHAQAPAVRRPHRRRGRRGDARELPLARAHDAGHAARDARARAAGCIVNVSSLGGRLGIAHEAAYCASKFALCGWTEAMAIDLWDTAVDVRLVIPGAIDTEIWDQPGNDPPLYDGPLEPPETVAEAIAAAIEGDRVRGLPPRPEGHRRVQDRRHRRLPRRRRRPTCRGGRRP